MELMEPYYDVLVVSSSEKFNRTLPAWLPDARYRVHLTVDSIEARRKFLEHGYDLALINTPLPDESGVRLALDFCEKSNAVGVLILVRSEHFSDIQARVTPLGVFVVEKPTSARILIQSMGLLCATRERLRRMEQKSLSIEEKMEEIRIVGRAKCVLIEQMKMTEREAHRYIEKQAMDRCVTRQKIAEGILKMYH